MFCLFVCFVKLSVVGSGAEGNLVKLSVVGKTLFCCLSCLLVGKTPVLLFNFKLSVVGKTPVLLFKLCVGW